jgi:hypothetical protein
VIVDQRETLHQRLAWAPRYLLDWGACGERVTPIRAYTTVLRWFRRPGQRVSQLSHVLLWLGPDAQWIDGDLADNLNALVAFPIRVGAEYPCAPFGFFLASLADGRIDVGGPTPRDFPPELVAIRPGFFYLLHRWLVFFPSTPIPWPWWAFPTARDLAGGG